MGSKGSKPRKPSHSQHLPKVGSATENRIELHEEQEAVLGQLGLRNASPAVKYGVGAIVLLIVAGAIFGLLFWAFSW